MSKNHELSEVPTARDLCSPTRVLFKERLFLTTGHNQVAGEDEKDRILALQKQRFAVLERNARSGSLQEYVPLTSEEDLSEGRVVTDIPGLSVAYTREEYAEHIRNIMRISDMYPNYRFCSVPEVPFEDVKVIISEQITAVIRLKAPHIAIMFEHPDLCRSFVSYAEHIRDQYRLDRLTTGQILERYLR